MEPEILLQNLIKFNTVNPPGNEYRCIKYIDKILTENGIKTKILFKDPKRLNLYARIKGGSNSSPLLIYGHLDVVKAESDKWSIDPFKGIIKEGMVWGRGALDMKGGIAMYICAVLKAVNEKVKLPGDIILCFLSDEEEESKSGAEYITENYKDLFNNVKYAISEFGGFTIHIAGKKFYPVQIAEKQICRIEAVFTGDPGHGSLVSGNTAFKKAAQFINKNDYFKYPVHIHPAVKLMVNRIGSTLGFPLNLIFLLLLNPALTNLILKIMGPKGDIFKPMFKNILNPSVINGGDKINVIPSDITVKMDGRLIPGVTKDDFIYEIKKVCGSDFILKNIDYKGYEHNINQGLFSKIESALKESDPEGIPVPFLLPGSTDARFFSKLGIQTYGFIPIELPKDIPFFKTIHGIDERIPVASLKKGVSAVYNFIKNF